MKNSLILIVFLLLHSSTALPTIKLRLNGSYRPESQFEGEKTGLKTQDTIDTTRTHLRADLGLKFGRKFALIIGGTYCKFTRDNQVIPHNTALKPSSTKLKLISYGPWIGIEKSRFTLDFFYYYLPLMTNTVTINGIDTNTNFLDGSGMEINLGYTIPISKHVSIGPRAGMRDFKWSKRKSTGLDEEKLGDNETYSEKILYLAIDLNLFGK